MKGNYALFLLLLLAAFFSAGYYSSSYLAKPKEMKPHIVRDTVRDTLRDTVDLYIPPPAVVDVIRTDSDTLRNVVGTDSTPVIVPIERKTYETDDYRISISGYKPRLDSVKLFRESVTNTITNTVTNPEKTKKFSLGLQVGFGATKTGLSPYLGFGITYHLISF